MSNLIVGSFPNKSSGEADTKRGNLKDLSGEVETIEGVKNRIDKGLKERESTIPSLPPSGFENLLRSPTNQREASMRVRRRFQGVGKRRGGNSGEWTGVRGEAPI